MDGTRMFDRLFDRQLGAQSRLQIFGQRDPVPRFIALAARPVVSRRSPPLPLKKNDADRRRHVDHALGLIGEFTGRLIHPMHRDGVGIGPGR